MNFSDEWRSLWPVSTTFSAPNLFSRPQASHLGPLLFRPSSPPLVLLSSPDLAYKAPLPLPPSFLLDGVRAFFRSPSNSAFLPSAAIDALAADFRRSEPDSDPLRSNNLATVRSRRHPSALLVFFPAGANAHLIATLALPLQSSLTPSPEVFVQREGFKHPCHRISKIIVAPVSTADWEEDLGYDDSLFIEGFLIAITMYSANWFRIETRTSESGGKWRPFLVPLAKQGFDKCVVDACWNPYFPEESAVLLEGGELCWFNLDSRRGGMVEIRLDGGDPGGWLRCQYGGQPWVLMVACSTAVLLVDLRKRDAEPKVLARIEMPDMFSIVRLLESERFLAFCKASYNDFHFSVVTEKQLLLFDSRQPLVPILTWDHGLEGPTFVAMYRLSELRPLEEFKWTLEMGFAILAGSFWNDKFNLFCYGPREGGTFGSSSFHAWELPSCLSLSGRQCGAGDIIVKEELSKDHLPNCFKQQQKKDLAVGFCIGPEDLLRLNSALNGAKGFAMIRLMLSGKLELQSYYASWDSYSDKSSGKERELKEVEDLPICCTSQEGKLSTRYNFFKFQYLCEYMNGNLSNALGIHDPRSNHKGTDQRYFNSELKEFVMDKLKSCGLSASAFINDASVPTSIFEIASRRILTGLKSDLLHLAFSKYSDLSGGKGHSYFEFLDVPSCLVHHRLPPFFVARPSKRSERCSKKTSLGEDVVGPVLPLPVLLTLQQMDKEIKSSTSLKDGPSNDSLSLHCKTVLESVFPEISIADTGNSSTWLGSQEVQDEMPFFVHEPTYVDNISSHNRTGNSSKYMIKEEVPHANHMKNYALEPKAAYKDEKFTTFICGIVDKTCCSDSKQKVPGSELSDMFNLSPVRLDFDSSIMFQPEEEEIYNDLKKQFCNWQDNYRPFQDFCASSKIPKLP